MGWPPKKCESKWTESDHLLDFCQEEQAEPAIQKLNLEDPQILRLLQGNEWRDLWRKGLNLVPKKHDYVKVSESHWKPWYNWAVFPFLMHMSSLLRSCCHITSILLYYLIHQTSLNHILIQMHHSRIWFHLFSRELNGPMIDQSSLGIRAQWCVWLQILQAAWPTSRWTAGFDSNIIISTLGGKSSLLWVERTRDHKANGVGEVGEVGDVNFQKTTWTTCLRNFAKRTSWGERHIACLGVSKSLWCITTNN